MSFTLIGHARLTFVLFPLASPFFPTPAFVQLPMVGRIMRRFVEQQPMRSRRNDEWRRLGEVKSPDAMGGRRTGSECRTLLQLLRIFSFFYYLA